MKLAIRKQTPKILKCTGAHPGQDSIHGHLQANFDIRWKADMRAIKRWQEATGRTLVWPDHADLCVWLLEQIDKLQAELLAGKEK